MLSIEIDGQWVPADDKWLVERILDGRAEELTPARDPTKSLTASPLIELLQPAQLEALTHRILQCLPGMYVTGPNSTNLGELLERVERLCGWNWGDPLTRSRLKWLEGWLAELAGSFERAVQCYDAYLRELSQEPMLRLLAYNNRGVLRVLLRQAEGVRDLACAAILAPGRAAALGPDAERPSGPDGGRVVELARLPAACFSLLNLLTHALNRQPLCDQVEDVLVDFMVKLPKRAREHCLGPDPLNWEKLDDPEHPRQGTDRRADDEALDVGRKDSGDGGSQGEDRNGQGLASNRLRKHLKILRDPTFVRLTRLVVYLADQAPGVASASDGACTLDAVTAQLQLWTAGSAAIVGGARPPGDALDEQRRRRSQLDGCAEAASLLYASDIPSSLIPGDGSISWVRQYANQAIGLAEEYCTDADYRLAESTLGSLSNALEKSRGDPLVEVVREEVTHQLGEVRRRAQAHEQLGLYQTCTDLVNQVREFCGRKDFCQAEFDAEILQRRVKQAQERLAGTDVSDGEAASILSDLPERIQKHLDRLEREDVEQRISKWREQLHAECPHDWREPVQKATYDALRKCQVNDPKCLVENWRDWRSRLDKHQARHHFRLALTDVIDGREDNRDAQEMLAQALGYDPGLTPASAPLYCVLALQKLENPPEDFNQTKADILRTARDLLQMEPLGSESLWSPAVRTSLVQEACVLLERLIAAYHGVGAELDELWQALEKGFAPAFAEAPPQILREILTLVDSCLKACPVHNAGRRSCIDPRNRLHVLQQTCNRVILIAEGEEALHDGRPQDARNRLEEGIETLALEGLLSDQDVQLLRRAVCAWYLAVFGELDAAYLQRRVLDHMDRWVDQIQGGDRRVNCSVIHIEKMIADARAQAGV